MSSSTDDVLNYRNLRNHLPEESMMPSAPLYDAVSHIESLPEITEHVRREEMIHVGASPSFDARKRLRIEAEIKKAQLKREQLIKERQIMEEEFKAKEMLLDAELDLVLTTFEGTEERPGILNNTSDGVAQLGNNAVNSFTAQNQVSELQQPILNAGRRGSPVDLPKPLGLEQLSVLDYVSIRQLVSNSADESYEVVAPGNIVILRANVTFVVNVLQGYMRSIRVDMFDSEVNELINLRSGITNSLEIYVNGDLASQVRRAPTFFKPMLMLHDAQSRPVLKIKGPSRGTNRNLFSVQTLDKLNIGFVDKSPAQVTPGYNSGNHAVITFPLNLDVRFKAAIIASSFVIATRETVKQREKNARAAILRLAAQYPARGYYKED